MVCRLGEQRWRPMAPSGSFLVKLLLLLVAVIIFACTNTAQGSRDMEPLELWQQGKLRGANVYFPPTGPSQTPEEIADGLKALRSWGANLVVVPLQRVYDPEAPYNFHPEALAWTDLYVDAAKEAGLFVCVTCRTGPGRADFNKSYEIYQQPEAQEAYARMWRDIAKHYRDREIVVGYSVMCEPHPEDDYLKNGKTMAEAAEAMKGTPADWNALARRCTRAIREVDESKPIIIGATLWSYPQAFAFLEPTGDPRTVYAVHYYGPHGYSHQEPGGDVHYPGEVTGGHGGTTEMLNQETIRKAFEPVVCFQKEHKVPIFAGEFGCVRWAPDMLDYLRDVMDVYEEQGWSCAYWVLRSWDAMDIEGVADAADKERYPDTPQLQLFKTYFKRDDVFPK
ncbi:MAG: glycoside hydrolase family 5 protein [Armatimonadetes bacterium]|nr:glycoside hydrolase family 5 protein [Armatimonadota bacterium]